MDAYDYENGFFQLSKPERLMKAVAHYELYKKIIDLPGVVIECGVFKGNSLYRIATYRQYLETDYSRKIYAFDIFGKFPDTQFEQDFKFRKKFIETAGEVGPTDVEIKNVLNQKGLDNNIEFVKGDILKTVPDFVNENPNIRISFLHIDVDIYEPTKVILEQFVSKVVKGGVIVFDDYGIFPGATQAIEEFFHDKAILKFEGLHTPSYIIK